MFYCLHSFKDSLGVQSFMITRALGCDQAVDLICGKVSNLKTEYYFSPNKELPLMNRKLPDKPIEVIGQFCSKVKYHDYIKAMYT